MGHQASKTKNEQAEENAVSQVSSMPDQTNNFESGGFHMLEVHGSTAAFTMAILLTIICLGVAAWKLRKYGRRGKGYKFLAGQRAWPPRQEMELPLWTCGSTGYPGGLQGFTTGYPTTGMPQPPVVFLQAPYASNGHLNAIGQAPRFEEVHDEAMPHFQRRPYRDHGGPQDAQHRHQRPRTPNLD